MYFIKIEHFCASKETIKKDKPENERKYLYVTYMTWVLYQVYIKFL